MCSAMGTSTLWAFGMLCKLCIIVISCAVCIRQAYCTHTIHNQVKSIDFWDKQFSDKYWVTNPRIVLCSNWLREEEEEENLNDGGGLMLKALTLPQLNFVLASLPILYISVHRFILPRTICVTHFQCAWVFLGFIMIWNFNDRCLKVCECVCVCVTMAQDIDVLPYNLHIHRLIWH